MTAILVILTIIIFITIDYLVYRKRGTALLQVARKTAETKSPNNFIPIPIKDEDMLIPRGVFLHPNHTWALILQSGKVKVGIDSFISKIVGTIDRVSLPAIGSDAKKGEPIFSINSKGRVLSFASPINGNIVSINDELEKNPALLNEPYRNGWSVVIEPKNLSSDIPKLKIAEDAASFVKTELKRFKEFLIGVANGNTLGLQTLQDGGLPAANVLSLLDGEKWKLFQKEFLNS